jgi:hypothetical protein
VVRETRDSLEAALRDVNDCETKIDEAVYEIGNVRTDIENAISQIDDYETDEGIDPVDYERIKKLNDEQVVIIDTLYKRLADIAEIATTGAEGEH